MARPDFRSQAAQRLSEERRSSRPRSSACSRPSGAAQATRRPQRPRRPDRPQPRPAAPDVRRGRAPGAGGLDHGARRPPAHPRPARGRRPLPAHRRRAPLACREDRGARARSRRIIEDIDDETALEIAIIENLQREDLSPLDEAIMYERMTTRARLQPAQAGPEAGQGQGLHREPAAARDAPSEIKQLVSLRKDTLSHAYELLRSTTPSKRRKLAEQVARGELSLVKLRERIEGRPHREPER